MIFKPPEITVNPERGFIMFTYYERQKLTLELPVISIFYLLEKKNIIKRIDPEHKGYGLVYEVPGDQPHWMRQYIIQHKLGNYTSVKQVLEEVTYLLTYPVVTVAIIEAAKQDEVFSKYIKPYRNLPF